MKKLLFLVTPEDLPYFSYIKPMLAGVSVSVSVVSPVTRMEVYMSASSRGFDAIVTTNPKWLPILVAWDKRTQCNLDDWAGSIVQLTGPAQKPPIPVLVLNPLDQCASVNYGKFLVERYLSKLIAPEKWFAQTEFSWEIATPESLPALYERFKDAKFIAIDTETKKEYLNIACSGYCGVWLQDAGTPNAKFITHTVVIPIVDDFMITWMEKFNALLPPKIFQNGMYDNAYFFRWGAPVYNWLWDTQHLFHCWYSELPKRLDFITTFLIRDIAYWKHMAETDNIKDYYLYNAKDCWATANAFLSYMEEAPSWALDNYINHEFPMVFPCLHTAMEGIAIDETERKRIEVEEGAKVEASLNDLRISINCPTFNPRSPKQVVELWAILGSKDIKSSDKKAQAKVASRHPLNAWIVQEIIKYREAAKLLSSYTKEAKLLESRWFSSFNPAGTDTGRLASRAHHFWLGDSLQTIPETVKSMFVADAGFHLFEIDYAQSEARCVAYLSGDKNLIGVVESGKDYHCVNVELFFGIPYSDTWDVVRDKVKPEAKPVRDLAKRTNHGANYNMGASVMLDTMGYEYVLNTKKLIEGIATRKIAARNNWGPIQATLFWRGLGAKDVCQFLLDTYAEIYPDVKGRWYDSIKYRIAVSKKLVSPLGWTRYCFGNPTNSKPALNSYVAHEPQNLSVSIINKAYFRIWRTIALREPEDFRLKAQIHDSTFGQYRIGREDLRDEALKLMSIPIEVIGSDKVKRTMVIPATIKAGTDRWSTLK
jgi:hypothetical protein